MMMLDSIDNGLQVYPTIKEDGQTRLKKYLELTEAQQLQDDCDVQATNIILHGLPPDVYVLLNHQEAAKDIWDKVKLLMKGEGHMVKQCTQPYRARSSAWFKEKLLLAEAREAGQILDEEQLAFIADVGITEFQVAQQTIPQNPTFQTKDLDAHDLDSNDISSAKASDGKFSSYDSDVLYVVPYYDTYLNDMINHEVQEMRREERSLINTSFLDEYECSSLALDREESCDEEDTIRSLETRSRDVIDQDIGVGDEEVVVGEGVVVTSSSLEMLTDCCLGGITVSLVFLEGLEEEALVELMVELFEEDDKKSKKYGLLNYKA
nr:hypothetical protein [Tanacetum cinerariifolium]